MRLDDSGVLRSFSHAASGFLNLKPRLFSTSEVKELDMILLLDGILYKKTCKSKAQYTKIRTNEDNLRPKKAQVYMDNLKSKILFD